MKNSNSNSLIFSAKIKKGKLYLAQKVKKSIFFPAKIDEKMDVKGYTSIFSAKFQFLLTVNIWFVVSFTVHDMKCPLRIIKDTGIFDLLLAIILAQEERLDKLPGPILEMQGQRKVHQKDKVVVLALVHFSCD